jgi:hypothetical protein
MNPVDVHEPISQVWESIGSIHVTQYRFIVQNSEITDIEKQPKAERCAYHNCADEQCAQQQPQPQDRAHNYKIRRTLPDLNAFGFGIPLRRR